LLLKVVACGYVESHETEVPFTHLPKFHISGISQEQWHGCVVGLFLYVVISLV